jgi:hypothetical protein
MRLNKPLVVTKQLVTRACKLNGQTRQELYSKAKSLRIEGWSKMSKTAA